MAATLDKCFCNKCGKTLKSTNFYLYKDGTHNKLCKKCLTMHVDIFNPETFTWILQDMDYPYVRQEWDVIRDRAYEKDPYRSDLSTAVLGKYIGKMKLIQWKNYTWADSERLQKDADVRQSDAENGKSLQLTAEEKEELEQQEKELKAKLDANEITESEYKTLVSTPTQVAERPMGFVPPPEKLNAPMGQSASRGAFTQQFNAMSAEDEALSAQLTDDDRTYLSMKWGSMYKPTEWITLEKDYQEMMASFDIQDADTLNTLNLLCKTNLKMNQSLDIGDFESYGKLSKVSESLRKTAKFTAAQNKAQEEEAIDSIGELVSLCEREGFIPRYATDIPQDKVDLTLKDMNEYLNKLVTKDLGFGKQIEDALKKMQLQAEAAADEHFASGEEDEKELTDDDFNEFYEFAQEQKEQDILTIEEEAE